MKYSITAYDKAENELKRRREGCTDCESAVENRKRRQRV